MGKHVIMTGFMGAGKTTVGKHWQKTEGSISGHRPVD